MVERHAERRRRLAELLTKGRLVEIPDSCTLIPLDQPARLAQIIRDFPQSSNWTTRDLVVDEIYASQIGVRYRFTS